VTSVLLIYPFFLPRHDRSIFRFPPLGLGYIAASLKNAGHTVSILDCTFRDIRGALDEARRTEANVIGIYSMASLKESSLEFARRLHHKSRLLIAGGPLPTVDPALFLKDFDIVVRGEGEKTVLRVLSAYERGLGWENIPGAAYRRDGKTKTNGEICSTPPVSLEANLDNIAFPARELLPSRSYIEYWKRRFGVAKTTVMTTRGCPFNCEFCSNAVFGVSYRERSAENVIDEVEQALGLGFNDIHFADDVFTLTRKRVLRICDQIEARGLRSKWECLGRVDSVDAELAARMGKAGCERMFFGIESASDHVLALMRKSITRERARQAVAAARSAGIKVGAFFIACYPGETDDTVLETIRFANRLGLDYLSFAMPCPLPGTALYERVKGRMRQDCREQGNADCKHYLTFDSGFSEAKTRFAILKGEAQFKMRQRLRKAPFLVKPFESLSDLIFRAMR